MLGLWLLVNLVASIRAWRYPRPQHALHATRRPLKCATTIEEVPLPPPYAGPLSSLDDMEVGFSLEELGINAMVGPATCGHGRGLFLNVQEDVEQSLLPTGTVICGYGKGTFHAASIGDKTVAYRFMRLTTPVIFDKQIMYLYEALYSVTDKVTDFAHAVAGHYLEVDEMDSSNVTIHADASNGYKHYFVPDPSGDQLSIVNLGKMANDLAYDASCAQTKEQYEANARNNAVLLVWRMELQGGQLVPSWPVLATGRDLLLTNKQPMEVGAHYSWSYWEAQNRKKSS